jgi:hypothetical protein
MTTASGTPAANNNVAAPCRNPWGEIPPNPCSDAQSFHILENVAGWNGSPIALQTTNSGREVRTIACRRNDFAASSRTGSSYMPHCEQVPRSVRRTSGCIGQVYIVSLSSCAITGLLRDGDHGLALSAVSRRNLGLSGTRLSREHPPHCTHELIRLFVRVIGTAVASHEAVPDVPVEQAEGDLVKGGRSGVDLRHHVDAVAIILDHPRHASDLPLDPGESIHELILRRGIAPRLRRHVSSRWPCPASLVDEEYPSRV